LNGEVEMEVGVEIVECEVIAVMGNQKIVEVTVEPELVATSGSAVKRCKDFLLGLNCLLKT
jgi:hypothetical protein